MSSQIEVIIKFKQPDHKGKEIEMSVRAVQEVKDEVLENLDTCESTLLSIAYEAMRTGMSTQMSYVSEKKALQQQNQQSR